MQRVASIPLLLIPEGVGSFRSKLVAIGAFFLVMLIVVSTEDLIYLAGNAVMVVVVLAATYAFGISLQANRHDTDSIIRFAAFVIAAPVINTSLPNDPGGIVVVCYITLWLTVGLPAVNRRFEQYFLPFLLVALYRWMTSMPQAEGYSVSKLNLTHIGESSSDVEASGVGFWTQFLQTTNIGELSDADPNLILIASAVKDQSEALSEVFDEDLAAKLTRGIPGQVRAKIRDLQKYPGLKDDQLAVLAGLIVNNEPNQ